MSDTQKFDRKRLVALIEEYGGTIEDFDALPADSYEQALAGQSLDLLEQFYLELFRPGQSLEETREKCSPWPPKTQFEGKPPSEPLLGRIMQRFKTAAALNGIAPIRVFLEQLRKAIAGTPIGDNDQLTDAIVALAGQELIKAKMNGVPVSANLNVLDRLQYERRSKLKEREVATNERALDLGVKKYEDQRAKVQATFSNNKLTPEEKEARVKEALGIS